MIRRFTTRVRSTSLTAEAGMTTAEYAVGTVAACGFAGLLLKLLTSDQVRSLLSEVITRAFAVVS